MINIEIHGYGLFGSIFQAPKLRREIEKAMMTVYIDEECSAPKITTEIIVSWTRTCASHFNDGEKILIRKTPFLRISSLGGKREYDAILTALFRQNINTCIIEVSGLKKSFTPIALGNYMKSLN